MSNQTAEIVSLEERSKRLRRVKWICAFFVVTDLIAFWTVVSRAPEFLENLRAATDGILLVMILFSAVLGLVGLLGITAFCFYMRNVKRKEFEAAARGSEIPPAPKAMQLLQNRKFRVANIILALGFGAAGLVGGALGWLDFSETFVSVLFVTSALLEIYALKRKNAAKQPPQSAKS